MFVFNCGWQSNLNLSYEEWLHGAHELRMCLSSFSKTSVNIQKLGLLWGPKINQCKHWHFIYVDGHRSKLDTLNVYFCFLLFPILNTKLNPEIIFFIFYHEPNLLTSCVLFSRLAFIRALSRTHTTTSSPRALSLPPAVHLHRHMSLSTGAKTGFTYTLKANRAKRLKWSYFRILNFDKI